MKPITLAWVQLIGALLAGWFGWQGKDWGVLVLALVLVIMAVHHFMEK